MIASSPSQPAPLAFSYGHTGDGMTASNPSRIARPRRAGTQTEATA